MNFVATSTGITLDFLVYCGKGMYDDDDPYLEMPSWAYSNGTNGTILVKDTPYTPTIFTRARL